MSASGFTIDLQSPVPEVVQDNPFSTSAPLSGPLGGPVNTYSFTVFLHSELVAGKLGGRTVRVAASSSADAAACISTTFGNDIFSVEGPTQIADALGSPSLGSGSTGPVKWSDLQNAVLPLQLNNDVNGTNIGNTIPASFIHSNLTPATAAGDQLSPILTLRGQYFDGSASQNDDWLLQTVPSGSGASSTSALTISHSGAPGGTINKVAVSLAGNSAGSVVLETHNVYGQGVSMYTHTSTYYAAPIAAGLRSRGTQASPTPPQAGDWLGIFGFGGWTGSTYVVSANIVGLAVDNFTGSAQGSQIVFNIMPTGTSAFQEVCRMGNSGLMISPGNTLSFMSGAGVGDVGWSRLAAGSVALGNGTQGDATGMLQLAKVLGGASMRGTASSASGTTATVTFGSAYASTPVVVVTPTSNCGNFYISAQSATGFTITYATAGAQSFNWIAIG